MILRKLIPRSLKRQLRRLQAAIDSYHFACPVCERRVRQFIPLAQAMPTLIADLQKHHFDMQLFIQAETLNLQQYACPWCRASDRTRLYTLFLRNEIKRSASSAKPRMLDIAPDHTLQNLIRTLDCYDYRSADLLRTDVDDQVDITDMHQYKDGAFDCFICSHVLEHVPDDRKAMRELFRILKTGGWGIAMAPIALSLPATIEDPTLSDPAERVRRFGQDDHLRLYARQDFIDRLAQSGFNISALGFSHFGGDVFEKNGITQSSVLYICRKP